MSNLTKALALVVVIMLIGVGLVVWKKKVGGASHESFNSITREEIEALLADVAKNNPAILKRFTDNPEMKKQQLESLKQMLAFASEAQRTGMAAEQTNKQELDNIKAEIAAVNYDREMNKDKGPMPPFGFITEDQIKAYWGEDAQPAAAKGGFSGFLEKLGLGQHAEARTHEAEFEDFLNAKIELMKASNPEMKDREISDEEKTQAKDMFAKMRIYRNEFETKAAAGELDKAFVDKVRLQIKLQQATFLMGVYGKSIAKDMEVTDDAINAYIAAHPELDPKEKRAKAEQILKRAQAGEDFAALANELTEDPGNKGADGQGKGGLYDNVPKGRMVKPFEEAALALDAGQIAPEPVESDFGYHIIKLERKLGPSPKKDEKAGGKDVAQGDTYDVRHILISTGYTDPETPGARPVPVKEYVRSKLEEEKEKALIEKLVAANGVTVPDDFSIPEISPEQLEEMNKRRQQMQVPPQMQQPPAGGDVDDKGGKPAAKPEPKKK